MDIPSLNKSRDMAAAQRAAKLELEKKEREAKELARMKEEEAERALVEKEREAERQRAAKLEAERAIKETELKAREVEARKTLVEKEREAERQKAARREAERAISEWELKIQEEEAERILAEEEKEFEETLMAKSYQGIEGEIFESTRFKDVYFDYDQYAIRPEDIDILQGMAALLLKHPKVKIQIEGHCDERGTQEYNLALGERRANSVKQYLISLGTGGDRISTISYGEEKPADAGQTEEAYRKNRRAHFIVLSK
jgi:peptidoglycan-associated lipoprotein